jgi:hypothetical protein
MAVFFIGLFLTIGFILLFYLGWKKASKEVNDAADWIKKKNRQKKTKY